MTPVQAIVDVPITEGVTAVIGARALPAVLFSGNYASYKIAPGGFLAVHIDAGPFFIRPELAMNGVVPLGASHDTTTGGFGNTGDGNLNLAIGLGIGGAIDFGKQKPAAAVPAGAIEGAGV